MNKQLTLGSLFDGSGGFPLGAILNGIKPLWASEIEPFPIRVTTKRLPEVKHLGDISSVNGAEIAPVDIITFGSPCTNLSVAGKREGLEGEQSSLFFEAVRIIKEMRCATNGKYPKWICWENVPGAYSSNQGKDFRQVLTEIAKIKNETYVIPMPEKDRWSTAGEIVGDNFSIAWRTVDAQFWGVAQRRRRCYLVADFTGECAGKVLFEFERLSGYTPQGFGTGQGTAGDSSDCTGTAVAFEPGAASRLGGHVWEEFTGALRAAPGDNQTAVAIENHAADSRVKISEDGIVQTLSSSMGTGGGNVPLTMKIRSGCEGGGKGALIQEDQSATLSTVNDQSVFVPFRKGTRPHNKDEGQKWEQAETANTLNTFDTGENRCNELAVKAYGICSQASNAMQSENPLSGIYEAETARTLDAGGGNPSCNQGGIAVCVQGSMIGREEKNGPQGSGINEETAFTLNTADRHAVAYAMTTGSYTEIHKEKAATLMARDYKDPQVVNDTKTVSGKEVFGTLAASMGSKQWLGNQEAFSGDYHIMEPEYLVRRLTPTECALLQGFPSDWCAELETPEPTDEDIAFWTEVFDTYAKINSKKPKTRNQVIKWLQNPHTDSAEYKMWGNGVALPCVCFVMAGIAYFSQAGDAEKP